MNVHTEFCFLPLATGAHGQDDQGDNGSSYKWARFIIGHILSAVAVIYEISQLSVCFDEKLDDDDETLEEDESLALESIVVSLVLCLLADVVSAVVLPIVYRRPFDIKSVHKVPAYDTRQCCCGTCIVHFLAPFTWGVELILAGHTSILHSQYTSCDGHGGEALETYFLLTGVLTSLCGLLMLGISALAVFCSCCTPGCIIDCCTRARELNRKWFLTKGRYIEYWCISQGAIWSYRTGSLNAVEAIIVAVAGFAGVHLAESAITAANEGMSLG